ncbi:MAG: Lrp/AsnC ligand binding domain-containing protein [Halobacteriaceae archaeon]
MTDAFVNVTVQPGAVSAAADEIAALDAVSDVRVVTGDHDIVALLEPDDKNAIPEVVADGIHDATGVVDTVTNVAFEP